MKKKVKKKKKKWQTYLYIGLAARLEISKRYTIITNLSSTEVVHI